MSCNHPFKAFDTGNLTDNGKPDYLICPSTSGNILNVSLAMKRKDINLGRAPVKAFGDHVFLVDPVPIPCGHCVGCRMDHAKEYANRAVLESSWHKYNYFITWTFDDEHLPFTKEGEPTIDRYDLKLLLQRWRKFIGECRAMSCGEYGSLNGRPHYHSIMFLDYEIPDLKPTAVNHFSSALVQSIWPFGQIDIQYAEPASIGYVARYVEKKIKDNRTFPVMPFLMTPRPALGVPAVCPDSVKATGRIYGNFGNVRHSRMPLIYKRKFENDTKVVRDYMKLVAKDLFNSRFAGTGIYDWSDDALGFLKDDVCNHRLEKVRKEKL